MKVGIELEGFTYNGIDSKSLKCYYIPDASDRWFESPDFEVYDQEVTGRPGGYYYGTRTKIRSFNQKMFFEDITISEREQIRQWLKQGTIGDLIFDDRPFEVFHMVTLDKVVPGKSYTSKASNSIQSLFSGAFTVNFVAYDPYGYLTYTTFEQTDPLGASMYCGMLKQTYLPSAPGTTSRDFIIYNCGNITCGTKIQIGGSVGSTGITIKNLTNGSKCKLNSLPNEGYLKIDGYYGTVKHVTNNSEETDYQYHDEGFLTLEPCGILIKDIAVSIVGGSEEVQVINDVLPESVIGRYMRVRTKWYKIIGRGSDEHSWVQDDSMPTTGYFVGIIATMNQIEITGSNIHLNKLMIESDPIIE